MSLSQFPRYPHRALRYAIGTIGDTNLVWQLEAKRDPLWCPTYPALPVLTTVSCIPLDLPCYNSSAEVIFIALQCHGAVDFKQPTFLWKPYPHEKISEQKRNSYYHEIT